MASIRKGTVARRAARKGVGSRSMRNTKSAPRGDIDHGNGNHGNGAGGHDLKQIIEMLTGDHETVDALFRKIEKLKKSEDDSRYELIQEVCDALTVHAAIEEELFYPAAREAGGEAEEELVDEAEVEHEHIRELVQQLKDMSEDDPLCDAKTKVLSEYVRHHVKAEESRIFPRLKKAKPDLSGLYQQMCERRAQIERGHLSAGAMTARHRTATHGRRP